MQKVNKFRKNIAILVIEEKKRIKQQLNEILQTIKTVEYKNFTPEFNEVIVKNSIFVYSVDAYRLNSTYHITHNVAPVNNEERPITKCIELDYYNYCLIKDKYRINLGAIEDFYRQDKTDFFIPKFNAGANKELYTKLCIDIFNEAAKDLQKYRVETQILVDDVFKHYFGFYVNRAFY